MFSTPMKSAGENVKDELITQNTLIGDIAQSLGLTVTEASGSNTKAQLEAFNQNLQLIKNGNTNFLPENIKSGVTMWECRNCGHVVVGTKAPEVCPVCNHPQSYFEVRNENY